MNCQVAYFVFFFEMRLLEAFDGRWEEEQRRGGKMTDSEEAEWQKSANEDENEN